MKKFASGFLTMMLILTVFVNSACAHVKPYEECKSEAEAAKAMLYGIAEVRDAYGDYITAFENNDQLAMEKAHKVLYDADLVSELKSMPTNMRVLKEPRDYFTKLYIEKEAEFAPIFMNYDYWNMNMISVMTMSIRANNENIPIVPQSLSTKVFGVIAGLQDDFFKEEKDLSGSVGNVYLIEATVTESYPDEGYWWLKYDSKYYGSQLIAVRQPSVFNGPDYDVSNMPAVGEKGMFYVTLYGMMTTGYELFILGADDSIVDQLRIKSTKIMPGEE